MADEIDGEANPFMNSDDEAAGDSEAAASAAANATADTTAEDAAAATADDAADAIIEVDTDTLPEAAVEGVSPGARAKRLIWSHTMNAYVMELLRQKKLDEDVDWESGSAVRTPHFGEVADKVSDAFRQYAHLMSAATIESKYKREKKRYIIWKTLKAFSGTTEPNGDTVLVASEDNLRSIEAKFSTKECLFLRNQKPICIPPEVFEDYGIVFEKQKPATAPLTAVARTERAKQRARDRRMAARDNLDPDKNDEVDSDLEVSPQAQAGVASAAVTGSVVTATRGKRGKMGDLEGLGMALERGSVNMQHHSSADALVISAARKDFMALYTAEDKKFRFWAGKQFNGEISLFWSDLGNDKQMKDLQVEEWKEMFKAEGGVFQG